MALQHAPTTFRYSLWSVKENCFGITSSFPGFAPPKGAQKISKVSPTRMDQNSFSSCCNSSKFSFLDGSVGRTASKASRAARKVCSVDGNKERSSGVSDDDSLGFDDEERREWRRTIREVIGKNPEIQEEFDPLERIKKTQKLVADYPLVVEEEDPDWPEDDNGWGFKLGQFFDKITIKNVRKDDEDYDSDKELVWQDDNYIRPIKDITTDEWEETVFKDFSPLIVLVHNRYRRPKENEMFRDELEKAVHIIWNCKLPSPRCVAIDGVVELDLVSALQVSIFPEILFTKAGKILYREKAKPPCLSDTGESQEAIPSVRT